MQVKEIPINSLKFSEYNPRKAGEKEYNDLKASITEFGIVDPIIVNSAPKRKNIVIGGHFRIKVCQEMGIKTIPVVYVNIPELKREQELNLRLNKNLGQWDWDLLANFDEELLKGVGFESEELDKIFDLDLGKNADEIPEVREKTSIKQGDLFKLGSHRLMCGDATKKEDVEKLMAGKKADMVFTDPPYGIGLDTDFSDMKGIGRGKRYRKVKGDELTYDPKHIFDWFTYCKEIFLWGADYYAELIPKRNDGCFFVWDKTEGGIRTNSAYEKQFGSNFELCWSKYRHKRQIIGCLWKGIFGLSKEDTKERIHPTQKPVRLFIWFIKEFSKVTNLIADLFGGSGSTLIACEQLSRICYMMEIDPIYCDVIIRRWENYTGKKAVKLNGKART